MVYSEGAKIMEPQEIKEMLDEEYSNPTIDRLLFIEAKAISGEKKIFPCYVAGYYEDNSKGKPLAKAPETMFLIFITQATGNGNYGLLEVQVGSSELGISKRIWDKPPTKGLREETPWVNLETEVQ